MFVCSFAICKIQTDLGDIVDLAPDHCNKVSIIIKQVTWTFWFPSAYDKHGFGFFPIFKQKSHIPSSSSLASSDQFLRAIERLSSTLESLGRSPNKN